MTETARAVSVPCAGSYDGDMTPELRRPGSTASLRLIQSRALAAIKQAKGGLFPIGVGHGKTLIALLAGKVLGATMTVILTKASVVRQMERDHQTWAPHFTMPDKVRLLSYPALSRPERSEWLASLASEHGAGLVIVADECHELKRFTAARTKRVARLMERNPDVRFVALSGTITTRSIKDYAHLAEWALRNGSPVPRTGAEYVEELDAWCRAFDPDGRANRSDWDTVWPVVSAFGPREDCDGCHGTGRTRPPRVATCVRCGGSGAAVYGLVGEARQSYAQRALRARLHDCVGVVATTDGSVGASLTIYPIVPELPEQIRSWIALVDGSHENPDGEVLPDDLSRARARRNLSAGFYQRWEWGEAGPDKPWLEARRNWNMHVAEQLDEHSDDGYDSPLLVWREIRRQVAAGGRAPIHQAWTEWERERHTACPTCSGPGASCKACDGTGRVIKKPPPSVAEWYSGFVVDALVDLLGELGSRKTPAIVWYESQAIEIALREAGLKTYGAGTTPPDVKPGEMPPTVAMSQKVHGTGRNLQPWACNVLLEPPSDAGAWEQLIGRTHRQGQLADEVEVYVFAHGAFADAVESARERAKYIENTTGNTQKLLLASWLEPREVAAEGDDEAARAA